MQIHQQEMALPRETHACALVINVMKSSHLQAICIIIQYRQFVFKLMNCKLPHCQTFTW